MAGKGRPPLASQGKNRPKPENMNPNHSLKRKKRASTPKKVTNFSIVLKFKAQKSWERIAPLCARRVAAVNAFNHATANWHLLKRRIRLLEKTYIEWRDYELPQIKEQKAWENDRLKEIEDLRKENEERWQKEQAERDEIEKDRKLWEESKAKEAEESKFMEAEKEASQQLEQLKQLEEEEKKKFTLDMNNPIVSLGNDFTTPSTVTDLYNKP